MSQTDENERYKCQHFQPTATLGTIHCSINEDDERTSPKLDSISNELKDVCDFRCIALDFLSDAKFENFGRGPYEDNWFCVNPYDLYVPPVPVRPEDEGEEETTGPDDGGDLDIPKLDVGGDLNITKPDNDKAIPTTKPDVDKAIHTTGPDVDKAIHTTGPDVDKAIHTTEPDVGENDDTVKPHDSDVTTALGGGDSYERNDGERSKEDHGNDKSAGNGDGGSPNGNTEKVLKSSSFDNLSRTNLILICLGLAVSAMVNVTLCVLWSSRLLRNRTKTQRSPSLVRRTDESINGVDNLAYFGAAQAGNGQSVPSRSVDTNVNVELGDAQNSVYSEPGVEPQSGGSGPTGFSFHNAAFDVSSESVTVLGPRESNVPYSTIKKGRQARAGSGSRRNSEEKMSLYNGKKGKRAVKPARDGKKLSSLESKENAVVDGSHRNDKASYFSFGAAAAPVGHYAVPSPFDENFTKVEDGKNIESPGPQVIREIDLRPGYVTPTDADSYYSVPPGEAPPTENLYSGVFSSSD